VGANNRKPGEKYYDTQRNLQTNQIHKTTRIYKPPLRVWPIRYGDKEWDEYDTLDGVPVIIYYITTQEDDEIVEDSGDWGSIDWDNRRAEIVVDSCACDEKGISDEAIDAVCKKYNIKIK
jgi:hypothetical protein